MKLAIPALLLVLASLPGATPACAEKRVALVIGNANYQYTQPLANPRHDAEDLAEALGRVGFAVTLERDLDKRGMERAIAQFARDARDADAAFFYFAGHGLQHHGLNYLMPSDARLDDEFSLNFEMTRLDDVLMSLGQARGVRILVLDACRRNPLADRLAGLATTRDFASARGLARLSATHGMVVAYATQADQVAADGSERNSPFTASLVRRINEPGLEIGTLFRRVANDVHQLTGGRQLPELSVSLLGEFYFSRMDSDVQAWAKVRGSEDSGDLENFIARYGSSPLVTDARQRLALLERLAMLERLSRAREQAERERVAREQAERERVARQEGERLQQEQAEHERVAREQAEHERLVRERAEVARVARDLGEREKLLSEQVDRERLAREQAEREAAQREAQARAEEHRPTGEQALKPEGSDRPTPADPSIQTALLPPSRNPIPSAPPPLAGGQLVVELKKELKRVGCYFGRVDDKWPTDEAQTALQKFARIARVAGEEPTIDLLDAVRARTGRVCPLECGPRQVEKDGHCIAKRCPSGSELDEGGDCRPARRSTASRPEPTTRPEPIRPEAAKPEATRPGATRGSRGQVSSYDPYDRSRIVTPGGMTTCGGRGCQTVPQGCHAVRNAGGHGLGGKIVCP